MRRAIALVLVVAAGATPVRAGAQAPTEAPFSIEWTAPVGCPGRTAALVEVTRILGHPPVPTAGRRVAAQVRIEADGSTWQVHVQIESGEDSGERTFTGASCSELVGAAALVLAIAIDPDALSRAPGPTPTAPIEPVHARAVLGAHAAIDRGSLPALAPGVGISGGILFGALRIELDATYYGVERARVPGAAGAGGDVLLVAGTLRACGGLPLGPVELGLCLAGEAGAMRGAPFGLDVNPRTRVTPWVAALAGAFADFRIGELFSIRVGVEAGPSILRRRFVVDGVGPLFEPSSVIGRATLGFEVRLR